MLSIIWKQIKKYKYFIYSIILIWIILGIFIFRYRYQMITRLYLLFSEFPLWGESDPKKAYNDYVKPAIEIIETNKINLQVMKELCPSKLKFNILYDLESEWTFLRKYNFFKFDIQYVSLKSHEYWKQKQPFVIKSIQLINEASKYTYEIPGNISGMDRDIILPLLLEQLYSAICLPYESQKYWKRYIDYLESLYYKNMYRDLEKEKKDRILPFPKNFDLDLLKNLENNYKYIFAIKSYIGSTIPYTFTLNCPHEVFICTVPEEGNIFLNKLIFISPDESLGNLFLSHARIYLILSKKYQDDSYLQLALDRYAGALQYSESKIDAYLEMMEVFLLMNKPELSLETIRIFSKERPKRFLQEEFYKSIIIRTLTALKRYKEADCFREQYIKTPECYSVVSKF